MHSVYMIVDRFIIYVICIVISYISYVYILFFLVDLNSYFIIMNVYFFLKYDLYRSPLIYFL